MTTYLSSVSEDKQHPLLIIPNDEGCLIVLGANQAQKDMSPKQMCELAANLIQRASRRLKNGAQEKTTDYTQ
jgi:hypothetical protein